MKFNAHRHDNENWEIWTDNEGEEPRCVAKGLPPELARRMVKCFNAFQHVPDSEIPPANQMIRMLRFVRAAKEAESQLEGILHRPLAPRF